MNVLDKIFAQKAEEVARAKERRPFEEIRAAAEEAGPTRGFLNALKSATTDLALIAEVKKASPSKGVIRENFDPVEIARIYEREGAHALSVLTDEQYFQGSAENLVRCREATSLPCLRKDFLNDPYQVYEARAWGADAILLIAASLNDAQMRDLYTLAKELGMDVLVEVHTEEETDRALELGFDLIGVNNRNLADFTTSIEFSERLLPKIAPHAIGVSESALDSRHDLDRVAAAGAKAVLIGTSFCASPDIGQKVREVMGW
jgi:indole-3-glycerol phosphate synthase